MTKFQASGSTLKKYVVFIQLISYIFWKRNIQQTSTQNELPSNVRLFAKTSKSFPDNQINIFQPRLIKIASYRDCNLDMLKKQQEKLQI